MFISFVFFSHVECANLDAATNVKILLEVKKSFTDDPQNVFKHCLDVLRIGNNLHTALFRVSVVGLKNLVTLGLASCYLSGPIPGEIGKLVKLEDLLLQTNELEGPIPTEIGNCSNLLLNLANNSLSGVIPSKIGELSQLGYLNLLGNQLEGQIPKSVSELGNVYNFDLSANKLSGEVPSELGNMGQLVFLVLSYNSLSGTIPRNICSKANKTLEHLMIAENRISDISLNNNTLTGSIPPAIANLTNLETLTLYQNRLSGELPNEIGIFPEPVKFYSCTVEKSPFTYSGGSAIFNGEITHLRSEFADSLRARQGTIMFTGKIPSKLGKIRDLSLVDLSSNLLTGSLPNELSMCKELTHIDLNNNLLSGSLPSWLGTLPQLGELKLSSNNFTGSLPLSLFNCSQLLVLSLDGNSLNGDIPKDISKLSSLNVLKLNKNQLSGHIPQTIGNLSKLYEIQLSSNKFTGEIPGEIGQLKNLQSILDLSYNNLTGSIPVSLGTLTKLEVVDLSHNALTGPVPRELSQMSSLIRLNLSYNNLEGKLDDGYSDLPVNSFVGNLGLCGTPLDDCKASRNRQQNGLSEASVIAISAVSTVAAITLMFFTALLYFRNRRSGFVRAGDGTSTYYSSSFSSRQQKRPLFFKWGSTRNDFRWEDIMEATNNMSDEFIIGAGGSGTIYRAELTTGEIVAIKRIPWKDDAFLDKSFAREVNTIGRIKHRRLVKLLGYCSNKGAGSNLLIYEYMENGSVYDWLHQEPGSIKKKKTLDWDARLNIAVGLAQGVEYLHHDCVPKIIHRDIKSANILLDVNMDAHLGDFGLAKAITENLDSLTSNSNMWFAGSYGYIAPEYAYSFKATEKSDVYSMGIVLMELVTGRMPTGGSFGENVDMVRWVESRIEMQGQGRDELIDPKMKPLLPHEESAAFQVLEIGLQCTKTAPAERPSSRHACDLLLHVRKDRASYAEKTSRDPYA
ncbi:LRR receptor-like serine/threonine-protein kinase GSO1 [Tanacetum coccineum]|uniref:LRR receptor-like serine/threonine-protein kinase GSO1 n=1 Tax=Tanacetum coccineum TaxID=301880 RepID=A0ABQ5ELM1_9ASTR